MELDNTWNCSAVSSLNPPYVRRAAVFGVSAQHAYELSVTSITQQTQLPEEFPRLLVVQEMLMLLHPPGAAVIEEGSQVAGARAWIL